MLPSASSRASTSVSSDSDSTTGSLVSHVSNFRRCDKDDCCNRWCHGIASAWKNSKSNRISTIRLISYGMFLVIGLYALHYEQLVKNYFVPRMHDDIHNAFKFKAVGSMEQMETMQLESEYVHLQAKSNAVLQQELFEQQIEQYDLDEAKELFNESSYYGKFIKRLERLHGKLIQKINDTETELADVSKNLTEEEAVEGMVLKEIDNRTSSYGTSWICSNAPTFCEWIDGVLDLRKQADNEAAVILHDSSVWKNLSKKEAVEIIELADDEEWIQEYSGIAVSLFDAGRQYEQEAMAIAIDIQIENISYISLQSAANRTFQQKERMAFYCQQNAAKAQQFRDDALFQEKFILQYTQYAISLAIVSLIYFCHRVLKRTVIPSLRMLFECDMIDDGRPIINVVAFTDKWWGYGRIISSCVQHVLIFTVSIGVVHVSYNELRNNPHASQTVVLFVSVGATIQTLLLHFLPHLLSELVPVVLLHQQQHPTTLIVTPSEIPTLSIVKHSMMRFVLLFLLFTLEFLFIWLFIPQYVYSPSMILLWKNWYYRLGVILSIIFHLLVFESFGDDDWSEDHSTVATASSDDEDLGFNTVASGNSQKLLSSSVEAPSQSTEVTPLMQQPNQQRRSNEFVVGFDPSKDDNFSTSTTDQLPHVFFGGGRSGFVHDMTSTMQLSSPTTTLPSSPFFVRFHDDIAKIRLITDLFVIASSIHIIGNCCSTLLSIGSDDNVYSIIFQIVAIILGVSITLLAVISTVHLVLSVSYYFYSGNNPPVSPDQKPEMQSRL